MPNDMIYNKKAANKGNPSEQDPTTDPSADNSDKFHSIKKMITNKPAAVAAPAAAPAAKPAVKAAAKPASAPAGSGSDSGNSPTKTNTETGGSSPGGASTGGVGSGIGGAGTGGAATGGASTGGAGTVNVTISGNSGTGSNKGAGSKKGHSKGKGGSEDSPITINISNVGGTTDAGDVASGDGPGALGTGGKGSGSGGGGGGAGLREGLARCRHHHLRHGRRLRHRSGRVGVGAGAQACAPRFHRDLHQGLLAHRTQPQQPRPVAQAHHRVPARIAGTTPDRPRRPAPGPPLRLRGAARRDAAGLRRSRAAGQGALHRRLRVDGRADQRRPAPGR